MNETKTINQITLLLQFLKDRELNFISAEGLAFLDGYLTNNKQIKFVSEDKFFRDLQTQRRLDTEVRKQKAKKKKGWF